MEFLMSVFSERLFIYCKTVRVSPSQLAHDLDMPSFQLLLCSLVKRKKNEELLYKLSVLGVNLDFLLTGCGDVCSASPLGKEQIRSRLKQNWSRSAMELRYWFGLN